VNIVSVDSTNLNVLLNLAQGYEAEFSAITKKKPGPDGAFPLDTIVDDTHPGYILYDRTIPIGFCIKGTYDGHHDIAEFYIIPSYRSNNVGSNFAISIFSRYPGNWQVRQIDGAHLAIKFWRKVIGKFTNNLFSETITADPYWGIVTKQTFVCS
jgi:predicted acetyltransferase